MSFSSPISAVGATSPVPSAPRPAAPTPVTAAEDSVKVDALPGSPPPEVLAEMHTAAQAYDRLAAAGQTLQFSLDPSSGRLSVALADSGGTVLREVSPSSVLQIAAGGAIT